MTAVSPAQIVAFYRRRLQLPAGAGAGIAGNFEQESSDNPDAPGGGLDQGQGDRRHLGSAAQQLEAVARELEGPERGTLKALRGTNDPRRAALLFSQLFERPGVPMNDKRQTYAQQALEAYTHAPGAARSLATLGSGAAHGALESLGAAAAPLSDAQSADMQQLLALSAQPQQQSSAIAATPLSRPVSSGGPEQSSTGPRVPSAPTAPAQGAESHEAAVLALLNKLGQDAAAPPSSSEAVHPEVAAGEAAHPEKVTALKGLVNFDGKPVPAWIGHILQYVERVSDGKVKPEVESGYRSEAEQERIYDSGVRPAAEPGSSKHELKDFPGGAVDLKNAKQVAEVLARSPYAHLLVWAGAKDPVHFSHPVNGTY